jgi:hypothetical protein
MASYQEEIKKLGIQPSDFMEYMNIKNFKYHAKYKTSIYQKEIKENVIKFLEYKINNLQETLRNLKDERKLK